MRKLSSYWCRVKCLFGIHKWDEWGSSPRMKIKFCRWCKAGLAGATFGTTYKSQRITAKDFGEAVESLFKHCPVLSSTEEEREKTNFDWDEFINKCDTKKLFKEVLTK